MRFRDDYAAAGVPMLPAVASARTVARKIVIYSWVKVATTIALAPYAGWIYTVLAATLGSWFLREARRLHASVMAGGSPSPMRLFHLSIGYLTLLFAAIAGMPASAGAAVALVTPGTTSTRIPAAAQASTARAAGEKERIGRLVLDAEAAGD